MSVTVLLAYALGIAVLLGSSALLLERALTSLGLPVRWVWIGALGLSAVMPLASLVSGTQQRSTPGGITVPEVVAPAAPPAPVEELPARNEQRIDAVLELLASWRAGIGRALASGASVLPTIRLAPAAIAGAWSAVSILVGLVLLASILRLRRREKGWPVETVLGRRVKLSPDLGPATVGVLTPRIVIPRWAKELPPDELELVLRHESEHVRSRDTLVLALGLVAVAACPWNPLVWWQVRRLKAAVEVDCDRRVLRDGVAPARYGNLLVRLGIRKGLGPLPVPTIGGSISLLERRLTAMKNLQERASIPTTLAATASALFLVLFACTSEPPMATETRAAAEPAVGVDSPAASEASTEEVVAIWVDREGPVRVNEVIHPVENVAEAVAPLYSDDAVVSLEAHEAAPYRVVAAVQEQLREAGLLRVVFITAESEAQRSVPREGSSLVDAGLPVVLPEPSLPDMRNVVEANPRNILFLEVLPEGMVAVRRGADPSTREIAPREVEGLWRQEVALNPSLIALVETHPEAEYRHMYEVLGALRRADATRFSLQLAN